MADIDLNDLSLKELKALQTQVAKAIASFEDRRKNEALSELEEKARELGFTLAELTGTSVPRKRASAEAKYANPSNAADTWSGRGRKPRWFEEALKAGRSADDLRV
ncbi:H-NS histone family protein [Cereibacter sphaeroides]|uniref:H-NS histone family protein n=1 Tax=Cereibacter sphaeroides TaxID=1063 RepID=UPI001F319ACA|nr:H-NS histone family protein [Cereibacter sphaeroides]MCE6957546.1 H-NS histone family protein [Cereibacter sphaeroides]MCE6971095.1 H-NS histone family protein [Cereibacter sphaeroides]